MPNPQPWLKPVPEIEHPAAYKKSVSAFMYKARLDVCGSCEFLQQGTCMKCGCNVEIKSWQIEEHCPIHKW